MHTHSDNTQAWSNSSGHGLECFTGSRGIFWIQGHFLDPGPLGGFCSQEAPGVFSGSRDFVWLWWPLYIWLPWSIPRCRTLLDPTYLPSAPLPISSAPPTQLPLSGLGTLPLPPFPLPLLSPNSSLDQPVMCRSPTKVPSDGKSAKVSGSIQRRANPGSDSTVGLIGRSGSRSKQSFVKIFPATENPDTEEQQRSFCQFINLIYIDIYWFLKTSERRMTDSSKGWGLMLQLINKICTQIVNKENQN